VNDAGDPAEKAEEDVEEECETAGSGEGDGERWEEDGENVVHYAEAGGAGGSGGHCCGGLVG
jgi:hypothetical protein